MKKQEIINYIINWLNQYCSQVKMEGFVIGISGGIDSALTSTLCAKTGKKVICVNMPIHQHLEEYERGKEHIEWLNLNFKNCSSIEVDLTSTFELLKKNLPESTTTNMLAMANTRSRLRMTTLYAIAGANKLLVAGTGNKVEDFGVGFFTKYGDGGVDLSPIADLMKSEVFALAKEMGVVESILKAKPTDGLWAEKRTDEDQIGASYDELEWAMEYNDITGSVISERQKEVLAIYKRFNNANKHKMVPIPVCIIPTELKNQ